MKNNIKLKLSSFVVLLLSLPFSAFAQAVISADSLKRCNDFKKQFNGAFDWVNPAYCTATSVGLLIIKVLLEFSGTIAVIFIMIGGFFYLTSAGNEETAEKGKSILINAVIGLVVIILATTIVTIVSSLVTTGQ